MLLPVQAAEQRFANLWQQGRHNLLEGNIIAAKMKAGTTDPVDYCLSTIAPLYIQAQQPGEAVEKIKVELAQAAGPDQFFYPNPSIHISLLACTQRAASPEAFPVERIERVSRICRRVIGGASRVAMDLRGLNIIGNQVFIQAFPPSGQWAELRQNLETALIEEGEAPIVHPDKAPVHVNLMRITDTRPQYLTSLLQAIEQLRQVEIGPVLISEIELVMTDFVVSADHTTLLGQIDLV